MSRRTKGTKKGSDSLNWRQHETIARPSSSWFDNSVEVRHGALKSPVVLVWWRGVELRVQDNPALRYASLDAHGFDATNVDPWSALPHNSPGTVVVVVTLSADEAQLHDMGSSRLDLTLRSLQECRKELEKKQIPLLVRVMPCISDEEAKNQGFLSRQDLFNAAKELKEDYSGMDSDSGQGETRSNSSDQDHPNSRSESSDSGHTQKSTSPYLLLRRFIYQRQADLLLDLCQTLRASHVHWNFSYELDERKRDLLVERHLMKNVPGLKIVQHDTSECIIPPSLIRAHDGRACLVYTTFRKQWLHVLRHNLDTWTRPLPEPLANAVGSLESVRAVVPYGDIPDALDPFPKVSTFLSNYWPVEINLVHEKLANFVEHRIQDYESQRCFPSVDGTSRLSPYISCGRLSPRQILFACLTKNNAMSLLEAIQQCKGGEGIFVSELGWREFFRHTGLHFPYIYYYCPYRPAYAQVPWRHDPEGFLAWKEGRTGYPLIDAAMRQMAAIGWMHNRLRMLVASFLCKHLLIDWRLGERHFAESLIDYDFSSNNGGWQWVAGCGTDAQPYLRIFSPIQQLQKFDPKGTFIREWLPCLSNVSVKALLDPVAVLGLDEVLQRGYVPFMVDHKMACERARAAYRSAERSAVPFGKRQVQHHRNNW